MMHIFKHDVKRYQDNPGQLIDELIELIGEDESTAIGFRGIYKEEINETELLPSYQWYGDDMRDAFPGNVSAKMGRQLDGTSCMMLSGNWEYAGFKELKQNIVINLPAAEFWGNTEFVAVVKGQPCVDELWEDIGEIVLKDAVVVGYIHKSVNDNAK